MKLTVVIVSYNVKFYLEQCLHSLEKALGGIDSDIYVVDNHSQDGTVSYIGERFPDVHLVASSHNLGFARANNIAINQSSSEYVLLLNPDTIVGETTIKECISFMDSHADAGSIGVRMLKANGTNAKESRRGIPSPLTAFYKMSGLCAKFPRSHRFGHYYMSDLPWDSPAQIEVISGAFCFLRREALDKVGLLDKDFFMYGEDIDLSYRILNGGYKNWYLPSCILHYKGESTTKSSFRYIHVFYEAMLIFFRKHYGGMSAILSIPIKAAIYARALPALISTSFKMMRKHLGFYSPKADIDKTYVFVGSAEMINRCHDIANSNALTARFVEITKSTDFNESFDTCRKATNLVFDSQMFTYEQMFNIITATPQCVSLGTFDSRTNAIITQEEVFV